MKLNNLQLLSNPVSYFTRPIQFEYFYRLLKWLKCVSCTQTEYPVYRCSVWIYSNWVVQ